MLVYLITALKFVLYFLVLGTLGQRSKPGEGTDDHVY